MSSPTIPLSSLSNTPQDAEVRLVSQWPRSQSDYKPAHVVVSSHVYWKTKKTNASNEPLSPMNFSTAKSLELIRLAEGTWNDVNEIVKVDEYEGKMRISIRGRLHVPKRYHNLFLPRDVEIEIIPSTPEQFELWVNIMQASVAPWNLLEREIKDAVYYAPESRAEKLEKFVHVLTTSSMATKPSSISPEEVENISTLPERIDELNIIDELLSQGTEFKESNLLERVIADMPKCVGGLSSIFHLVSLFAHGLLMSAEANRGQREYPNALNQMGILLEYLLESLTTVMKSSQGVNEIDVEFLFSVLKQAICLMDMTQMQLSRGRFSQIMSANIVKEVETNLQDLIHRVVVAGSISKAYRVANQLEKLEAARNDGFHHVRPSLSAFFSCRTRELLSLRGILENWGSALVTQYGGVGKTALMIAFANRAERDGMVPGGVFWLTVDGGEKDVIGSLAGLAEKLTQEELDEHERQNGNLVLAALKQGLEGREGRWLLCLDNADDIKSSVILNEVCELSRESRRNGWVVVTSRHGQPHVWNRMNSEQKLILKPLSVEEAMVVLWRRIRKMETVDADDDEVMNKIKEIERDDADEYLALKQLCGNERECGLGGWPLALVLAGTYVIQFESSCLKYRNMFKNANRIRDVEDILRNTEGTKSIRESQRPIWATWKLIVRQLSEKAYAVLRAIAMLGPGGVRQAIVKGIVKGVTADEPDNVDGVCEEVVTDELFQNSLLIVRIGGETQEHEGLVYRMHRLVRDFVLIDMKRGSATWNEAYSVALVAVHEVLEAELELEGNSFEELTDVFGKKHKEFLAHASQLVAHHTLPALGTVVQNISKVENIHRYCGKAMEFLGEGEEQVQVWKYLLCILRHQEAAKQTYIGRLFNVLNCENREKEEKSRIADVYNSLGVALMRNGRLNDAASMHETSLQMERAIHGADEPHSAIAASLSNLGTVYQEQGRLVKAMEKFEQSLEMYRDIYGSKTPHSAIAMALTKLGNVYQKLGKLDKSLEKYKQSLQMERLIHGQGEQDPAIAESLSNLGSVYQEQGKPGKAMRMYEQSLQMYRAIYGYDKPHPDIANLLNSLGTVHEKLGDLQKALEKYEQSLEMYRAILGYAKPHLTIAVSLNNVGCLYQKLGNLDDALEKYEQSLQIYRIIHGHHKPHYDTAISLWNIGIVHHKQKGLNQATEFLEQSLEMLIILHAQNQLHTDVTDLVCDLAKVYEDQGRFDEANAIRKRNTEAGRSSNDEGMCDASGLLNVLHNIFLEEPIIVGWASL